MRAIDRQWMLAQHASGEYLEGMSACYETRFE